VTAITGTRESFDSVWSPYLTIAIVIAVLVIGTIIVVVIRYRDRGDSTPRERPAWLARAVMVWLVVIAAIVAVTLTLTFRAQSDISALGTDQPAATVDVTAFQWGWRFDYGGGAVVIGNGQRIPTLVVPTGELVRFNLVSRDVIHSFWIPEERFKRDAFPERESHFGLIFDDGPSEGRCAEFCGLDHYRMDFHVLPISPASFDDWLARHRAGGAAT
jgi:cytochrome c oxidase subunit 2